MGKYDIFISYRRSDGLEKARHMKSELKHKYNVWLDFDELGDGRFDHRILDAIADAPIFMFILTPDSFSRCADEDDWVRKEINQALKTDRKIIPVNFDGAFKSFPDGVPQYIKDGIGLHQFSKIDFTDLHDDSIAKLIRDRIAPVFEMHQDSLTGQGAEIHIETDVDCQVQRFHHELAIARVGKDNTIRLKKGRHKMQFVSVEDDSVSEERVYEVVDISSCDFIEVNLADRLAQKKEDQRRRVAEEKRLAAEAEARRKADEERQRKAAEEVSARQAFERRCAEAFTGHEYVDLGLPSGLLWASCNVGANSPEEYGSYFAWGETSPKKDYRWSTLKYCNDNTGDSFSKYNQDQAGTRDNKTELDLSDDAAQVNWGGGWRMPARKDWEELFDEQNCSRDWDRKRQGWVVKSEKNGNSIFLPAAGYRSGEDSYYVGESGDYWSSSLVGDNSCRACCCYFYSGGVNPSNWFYRCYGFSVRPVAAPLSPQ